MTTINTIEDLIKLLDENPHWVEALRERLLTRELIELPETLAQFAAEMREFAATANARFDRLEADVAELKEESKQTRADVAELKEEHKQTRVDVAQLQRDVQGIRNDLGPLKGAHARNTAHREAMLIADEFGFNFVRIVGFEDLLSFTRGSNADGIPANHIRSFRRADLIMDVTDPEGRDSYLAVEVSYTVDERDTGRAIRNAEFLTRFTGKPAYAVAAGLRYDQRGRPHIESGRLLWYEMDAHGLEAE